MKKQILATLKKMQAHLRTIEAYNELIEDNSYSSRHSGSQFSFNVKLYDWLDSDDVKAVCRKNNIQFTEEIQDEFNSERLDGIWQHCTEMLYDQFKVDLTHKSQESPFYGFIDPKDVFTAGRSGGHLILGNVSDFQIDINDLSNYNSPLFVYIGNWEDVFCLNHSVFNIDTFIDEMKEYCQCTNQKDLLFELKKISNSWEWYAQKAIQDTELVNKLEAYIEAEKKDFKETLLHQLDFEICQYAEGLKTADSLKQDIENNDYSRLDKVVKVDNEELVTNQGARVKISHAKRILQALQTMLPECIEGMHIGTYTINSVTPCNNGDVLMKIGCHFLSLNQCKQFINQ
jgi:hypothetical protein